MSFTDLRDFVAHLEKSGRLRRVTVPVSRDLEIAEIADRVSKGAPAANVALLFERVEGAAMAPLVAYMTSWSLFGMQRIIAWEAPLMGWHFVLVRVVPSLAFPVLAGWLVALFYPE